MKHCHISLKIPNTSKFNLIIQTCQQLELDRECPLQTFELGREHQRHIEININSKRIFKQKCPQFCFNKYQEYIDIYHTTLKTNVIKCLNTRKQRMSHNCLANSNKPYEQREKMMG